MLSIFKKKKAFKELLTSDYASNPINIDNKIKVKNKAQRQEYENIIYYPSSSKEWFSSIYCYNKAYIKQLIVFDLWSNNNFASFFNMFRDKIKIFFKRRSHNKTRYSANKVYVSRAE